MSRPHLYLQAAIRLGSSRSPYICRSCRLPPRVIPANLTSHRALATFSDVGPSIKTASKTKKQAVEPKYDPTTPPRIDHRSRLTNFFVPTGGIAPKDTDAEDIHALLIRAGYVRQAYTGIFHLLPLGLRVHEKLEALIDRHMRAVGASKLALSTISSEALWTKSGRLEGAGKEVIRFKDRKDTKYILSPTHEEEITSLVSSIVQSYRQLPVRLYQIGRKYRDERRPRAGLLRGKEFTMKDLYTFDVNEATAIATYNEICKQYKSLFEELKIPFIVAEADSGTMGGNLSHEYHLPSPSGEDVVISCTSCKYSANEACAESRPVDPNKTPTVGDSEPAFDPQLAVFHGITKDRKTLINVFYPKLREPATDPNQLKINDGEEPKQNRKQNDVPNEVNPHRLLQLIPEYDPSVQTPIELFHEHFVEYVPSTSPAPDPNDPDSPPPPPQFSQIVNVYDASLSAYPDYNNYNTSFANHSQLSTQFFASKDIPTTTIDPTDHTSPDDPTGKQLNLLKIKEGDLCPRCDSGSLTLTNAIELGHTFHLGTRYSVPLGAKVGSHAPEDEGKAVPMEMGCHGIGVSRMIPAIAETYRDGRGLMWPRVIAPFEVCIIGTSGEGIEDIYDILTTRDEIDEEEDVLQAAESGSGGGGVGSGGAGGGGGGRRGRMIDAVLDDRGKSMVWKMMDADLIGYPVVLVLGRAWKDEKKRVEVQCRMKGLVGKDKGLLVEVGDLKRVVGKLLDEL
ncbi:prolyl-tRNA synthetase 1 [Peziza echinospora]|nr:prolyl-tRNA synthetase 1 [Peziza echinospora]